jgi:hypothetical protein
MSILQRLLPIYLMEKPIFRGTIEQAYRRRRSILHLSVGDGEDWLPTNTELTDIANLFNQADVDPDNAVVATPTGINANELRQGGDFWKSGDLYDFSSTAKMRALGINDSFLSGDSNFSTLEATLSVFMEQMRAYREF